MDQVKTSSLKPQLAALGFILLLALLAGPAVPQSTASAKLAAADRDKNIPEADWPFVYYIDTEPWVGEQRTDLLAAIRLMVCSTSRQPIVELCLPQQVDGAANLFRMDLRKLQWEYDDWKAVLSANPYGGFGLVVRADWLLAELADETQSDAYHNLLFTSKLRPKTRDEMLALLGVSNERSLVFGMIEGESGVAKQGTRWIENRPGLRTDAWGTRDSLALTFEKDPLEHPDGSMVHDGEEWIFDIFKMSSTTGASGNLQGYALFNGQGNSVAEAPVALVEDSTNFRNQKAIRVPGGCVQCHKVGKNPITVNEIRRQSEAGVQQFVGDAELARRLQAFHLSDIISKEIERSNEDYQVIVQHITGLPSDKAAEAFQRSINAYDAPLDMVAASQEFVRYGYPAEDATRALQAASQGGTTGARISALARGQKIPREAWEQQFVQTLDFIHQWSKQND